LILLFCSVFCVPKTEEEKLTEFLKYQVKEKLFSAYQFSVKERGVETVSGFEGTISFKNRQQIDNTTLFDIASLTKVVLTVPVFYNLIYKKELHPECKVYRFFNKILDDVTILELIDHSSGYPAWIPFYNEIDRTLSVGDKKTEVVKIISKMKRAKGKKIYSDINYILLGLILEKIYEKPLDAIFFEFFVENSINSDICFNPESEIPQTSYSILRKNYPDKTVEDENSFFLGGKTGHTGLFASAGGTVNYFNQLLNKEWFFKVSENLGFAGFDKPVGSSSNYGFNPDPENQIGHLGFTGTAILIDLKKEKIAALFTNATHPSAEKSERKERIKKVRQQFFSLLT
jgi:serine-type D-Ala-D-Ala carboxypeptidase